jgi:RsiW-degrading membrane proteinase PrsW (M82 family)
VPVNKNTLYLLIGALVVVVIGLGVYVYREESKPSGVELKIDESGVSIEQN